MAPISNAMLRTAPPEPRTEIASLPGLAASGMPTTAIHGPSASRSTMTGRPRYVTSGAWAACPRSTTATPPGTGALSLRLM
ncbi:Uncharacterised protein [Bordetella pertussis]|nr:Uncharacterised protein [Bordetella pertussis]